MKITVYTDEFWPVIRISDHSIYFDHQIEASEEEVDRLKKATDEFLAVQAIFLKKIPKYEQW